MKRSHLLLAGLLTVAGTAGLAQSTSSNPAQENSTIQSVVYVELEPTTAANTAAMAALDAYGVLNQQVEGFLGVETFAQVERPGHRVLVETWRDQAAMDSRNPAAEEQLTTALQTLRLSNIDRRPYKALDTALSRAQGSTEDSTVYVISHVDAAPTPDLPAMLQALVAGSRQETGNLRFDILQHAMRGNHFTVIEAWQNAAALQAHAAAAHTRRFRDEFGPFAGSPLDERLFKLIHTVSAN